MAVLSEIFAGRVPGRRSFRRRDLPGQSETGAFFGGKTRAEFMKSMIENNILPRLAGGDQLSACRGLARAMDEDICRVVALALKGDNAGLLAHLHGVARDGVAVCEICEHILGPAAAELGRMWEDDQANFLEVTEAIGHLTSAVHRLSHHETADEQANPRRRTILMAMPHGESHVFGAMVVGTQLRLENFEVVYLQNATPDRVLGAMVEHNIGILGLSIYMPSHLAVVTDIIKAVRKRHDGAGFPILVGGGLSEAEKARLTRMDVDITADDGHDAVALALHYDALY